MVDDPLTSLLIDAALGTGQSLEGDMPEGCSVKISPKIRLQNMLKQEHLQDVMDSVPLPGESVHVISNARYDFWTWVPVIIGWLGKADHLWASTWVINRQSVIELFELYDAGKIAPGYVAVAIQRWADATGKTPKLIEG